MGFKGTIIHGREKADAMIRKVTHNKEAKIHWCETVGHCDNITVWLIYLRNNNMYEGFEDWYFMYMTTPCQGEDLYDLRDRLYNAAETCTMTNERGEPICE